VSTLVVWAVAWSVWASAGTAVAQPGAVAQPTTVDCLPETELMDGVHRTLGEPWPEDVQLHLALEGSPGGWRAQIRVQRDDHSLERTLTSEASTCRAMDDALIVVTALLVDEVRRSAPPRPLRLPEHEPLDARPETPPPQDAATTTTTPRTADARLEPASPSIGLSTRPDVALRHGDLRGPALEVGLATELHVGPWLSVLLGLRFVPTRHATRPDGVGARWLGTSGRIGVCVSSVRRPRLGGGGCALATGTFLSVEGTGLESVARARGAAVFVGAAGRPM
jgi:hypothetical protein